MFKMPVGLYEKALPDELTWEERLAAAGQAGYDFIEISIDESDKRLSRLDWSDSERSALRNAIDKTGIKILTMCLSGHRKFPLGSHDPEIRRRGLEILHKAIEFARDIGIRVVQVMVYDVFYEPSDEITRTNFIEGLRFGTLWAGQAGVMLGLENLDTPFADSLTKILPIIEEIKSPWLGLYPDIGNLTAAGYTPSTELVLAKNKILGIHVKDALPKIIRGVPFGKGIVDFNGAFQTLAEIGFWGMLGVEMWSQMHADKNATSVAADARQFVEALVEKTWTERIVF